MLLLCPVLGRIREREKEKAREREKERERESTPAHTARTKRLSIMGVQCEPVWPSGKALGW